jgi:sulfur-oxidizing protein SoxY
MGMRGAIAYISRVANLREGAILQGQSFRALGIAGLLAGLIAACPAPSPGAEAYDPWPGLVQDIFNNRPMSDGSDVIAIEMPYRAEDAAIVPVTLRTKLSADDSRQIKSITLVIDQNPAPMAAKFELGPAAHVSEISTRVRVNSYTNVHAVAELSDGKLYMIKTFVKASGGCSAPAAKDLDEAKNRLGKMKFREFAKSDAAKTDQAPATNSREAQIMIGHPNNSGLQMDQLTQLYIPAFFINSLQLWQDDSPVLAMEGGISISEDPNLRFTYVSNGAKHFRAEAKDTAGHVFQNEWNIDAGI